jgi:raffinose/stachyose/melibiose transport system permease protein
MSKNELSLRQPASFKKFGDAGIWILFLIPATFVYTCFMAFPLFNSMRLSLYTGVGLVPDHFVGIKNYIELFFNPLWRDKFLNALLHTFIFFGINMAFQNTLGLLFATLLATSMKGKDIYRIIIFLPATLSILVTGFLWKLILNPTWGALNIFLKNIGLKHLALPWLGDPNVALIVITLVSCWQWVGMPTMMFLAGLQSISDELFEAANIDGANAWQIFWKIKIPLLMPVIGIVSILTFVANFNAFDVIFAMAGSRGAPNYATDLMGTFFYRTAIAGEHPVAQPDMGIGAAVATITFFILFIGVSFWLFQSREHIKKDAVKKESE